MSPLKDPLRIENVENLEEDNHNETIKTEHVVKTEVKPKSKNCPSCGKYFKKGGTTSLKHAFFVLFPKI